MSVLGLCDHPIIVAPMAGGPSTPELVIAAADAGAIGFLAGGYQSADALHDQIAAVRSATTGAFGVNVFVPGSPTTDGAALRSYLRELEPDARALGTALGPADWDDDHWDDKAQLLVDTAPPTVSFTFGCPPPALVAALHHRDSVVMVTVTNLAEAHQAAAAGADVLCAQGIEAGAHHGTFAIGAHPHPSTIDLVSTVVNTVDVPVVAAGGVAHPDDLDEALSAGAAAVQAGTAFLRCPESGAHPLHKDALVDPAFTGTSLTKSFSGRTARGLTNAFMRAHPAAPDAYPEINNATRPLRAAATNRGDVQRMSLWAGTGHAHARDTPAREVIHWLAGTADPPTPDRDAQQQRATRSSRDEQHG